jgi:ABC-type glutathione transport system ATPase component
MSCIVELKDASFSAQGRRLVRNVSFQLEEGKTVALIGPSGCGKSTVLKLAAGLCVPDEGEVLFRGRDINRMGRQENLAFRQEAAVVFQDSALWANQNLFQILELPLRVHFPSMTTAERIKRIESVAAEVGYKKDLKVRPAELSMGEQKLIAFARAMICHPRLLYLDEWTESLDQNSAKRLIELVKKFRSEGISIVMVSHNINIIRNLADFVTLILAGQVSLQLTREQIENDESLGSYLEKGIAS